jgi:hypothetical protein
LPVAQSLDIARQAASGSPVPRKHDDYGDHPGKYGAINKEIWHVLTAPV